MRIIPLIFVLFIGISSYSQLRIPAETARALDHLALICKRSSFHENELSPYPVYRLQNGWYLSLYGKVRNDAQWNSLTENGVIRGAQIRDIATIKVPLSVLSSIDFSSVFTYLEIPPRASADLERVAYDVRVDSVWRGIDLPEKFGGQDVIIGITDWGFDYTHPMLYDTLLQHTRILAAWDQYKLQGDHPESFPYGVEYEGESELLFAQGDTSNIYGFHTHGTHVAGITGGSGAGLPYRGMAPAAEFLLTTFLVDAASVLDAFTWMKQKADEEEKRLVINMSWGLHYFGTLDGSSLISQAIDALSEEGVVFVSSAGNNGDVNFHLRHTFNEDTISTRVSFESYSFPTMWGQSLSMWGQPGKPFAAGIRVYNTSAVLQDETPFYHTDLTASYIDSILVINEDTVYFNLTVDASHPLNGRPHIRFRVKNEHSAFRIVLVSTAAEGEVHYWNVVELTNGVGNWGQPFSAWGSAATSTGDKEYGISEPACTQSVIAVAAYSSRYLTGGGNLTGGQIAPFTSYGPLINGVMKPDIAAPGVQVVSSMSYWTDASYTTTESVEFNGLEYDFGRFSGTSMSSPCVAGIVALMLDANPTLSATQVKDILQATARQDEYTGVINLPGHVRWGRGKVNAYAAVLLSLATVGVDDQTAPDFSVSVYPNPASQEIFIQLPPGEWLSGIHAIDLSGRRTALEWDGNTARCGKLATGTYVLEIRYGQRIGYSPVVIQR